MEKFKSSNMIGGLKFAIDGVDLENHRIPVVLSDESEVVRYSWSEGKYYLTLKHGVENVDLSRADILMMFINHNTYDLPISKFEDVRLEDKKLKAWAVFDNEDDESMKIFRKLAKGFLKSFSVGINVIERELTKEEDGVKYYDVTKWAIDEASVVGIPAIPTAKVGLNEEENSGVNRNQALAENQILDKGDVMTEEELQALRDDHAEALKTASADAQKLERKRVGDILLLSGDMKVKLKAIEDGSTVGDAAIALNKALGADMDKKKTDFEQASDDVQNLDEVDTKDDEELSAEQKAEKEANEALEQVYGGDK